MGAVRRAGGRVRLAMVMGLLLSMAATAVPVGAATPPVYARPTGHVIPAELRPFWESLGGADGLGWPLSGVKITETGIEQWFEYGRIYQNRGSEPTLATIGRESAQFRSVMDSPAFQMRGGPSEGAKMPNMEYVAKTGHYVGNGFLSLWTTKKSMLGAPISEEFTEDDVTVQYFERGRLEINPAASSGPRVTTIGLLMHGPATPAIEAPMGAEAVGQIQMQVASSQAQAPPQPQTQAQAQPQPQAQTQPQPQTSALHSGRWVLVNLSQQRLYAYEGSRVVNTTLVSTGLPGKETPVGSFWVQQRYRATLMQGPGYYLPDVPFTQYFGNNTMSWQAGYALHGTYWHSNFGTRMSSGCVNMNNDFAAFIWDFAAVGTPVEVVAS